MNFAKYTEILMKNKIQSPISHNMGPYFIEIHEFCQVCALIWPYFWPFFGLFARAMHPSQTFALVYQTATARCAGVDGGCAKIFAHYGTKGSKLSSHR